MSVLFLKMNGSKRMAEFQVWTGAEKYYLLFWYLSSKRKESEYGSGADDGNRTSALIVREYGDHWGAQWSEIRMSALFVSFSSRYAI